MDFRIIILDGGGEDDELRRRMQTLLGGEFKKYIQLVGKPGGLTDLEDIQNPQDKLQKLTEKNPVRWEGAAKHKLTWKDHGLNQIDFYEIISQAEETISEFEYKTYTIKLKYDLIKPFEKDD